MNTFAFGRSVAALFTALCLLLPNAGALHAEGVCPTEPAAVPLALPHLRSALNNGVEGVIVALGSSSTQGAMATNLGHSYPAILQGVLAAGLPTAHVAVINRGIGGQDAAEELARMHADVLAIRPQAVIWQVGANGVDVILMDNQQSPQLLAKADEAVYDRELAQVASETGATLFSRRALMRSWRSEGFAFADFIAVDGLHHKDRGYFCVADALAKSMLAGLKQDHPLTASR